MAFQFPISNQPNRAPDARLPGRRRGSTTVMVLASTTMTVMLGSSFFWIFNGSAEFDINAPLVVEMTQEVYIAQVIAEGEIESGQNTEFRVEVRAKYVKTPIIISLIPEGTHVGPGDVLVKLDSAPIESAYADYKIRANAAEAKLVLAEASYKNRIETRNEYESGSFATSLIKVENQIAVAEQNVRTAKDNYLHQKQLAEKGFITELELRTSEFKMTKYANDLKLAKLNQKVLVGPTKLRYKSLYEHNVATGEISLLARQRTLEIYRRRLEEIEEQIDKCTITVPEGLYGEVVYKNYTNRGRGKPDYILEEGKGVREKQTLILLPNMDQLTVKAMVTEADIKSIKVGLPVSIKLPSLIDVHDIIGEVIHVNQYSETGGWGSGGEKKYAVLVSIFNPPRDAEGVSPIRPGMNASVTFQMDYQESALQIPIQCLYRVKGRSFCLVGQGDFYETVEVAVQSTNKKVAWLLEDKANGITKGAPIVMSPGSYMDLMSLPEFPDSFAAGIRPSELNSLAETPNASEPASKSAAETQPLASAP